MMRCWRSVPGIWNDRPFLPTPLGIFTNKMSSCADSKTNRSSCCSSCGSCSSQGLQEHEQFLLLAASAVDATAAAVIPAAVVIAAAVAASLNGEAAIRETPCCCNNKSRVCSAATATVGPTAYRLVSHAIFKILKDGATRLVASSAAFVAATTSKTTGTLKHI